MSDPIRMTAHAIGAAVDFNEIDPEDVFIDSPSYDALAAELARCRSANVYDGAAHKRVAELEAALRKARDRMQPLMCRDWTMEEIDALLATSETEGDANG